VTAVPLADWVAVRAVFLWSQRRLVAAQADYYTMEDQCSEHIELAQEHIRVYRQLLLLLLGQVSFGNSICGF
jgi:hypothetical protein